VNPSRLTQPYRYVYMGASALGTEPGPLKNIIKVDADTGQTLAFFSIFPLSNGLVAVLAP